MADYEVRLFTPSGAFVRTLPFVRLEYALVENDVGALTLALQPDTPLALFPRDAQIEIWRRVGGQAARIEGSASDGALWLVRKARYDYAGDTELITVTAYDAKVLLRQRFADGVAGSARASKSGALDNILRDIVRDALGANAGSATGRNLSSIVTVEADTSTAPTGDKAFAHRNILTVMQEVAAQSAQAGMYLSFDLAYAGRLGSGVPALTFKVAARQRGADRGAASVGRLVFSRQFGTLSDVAMEYDWTDEVSAVRAGGAGEGAARLFASSEDPSRILQSSFGRSEDFVDQTGISTASVLQREANEALWNGRPRLRMSGTLLEAPFARYGVHFNHGDIITVQEGGATMSARLSAVRVTVDASGEKVEAKVSTETVI